MHVRNGEGPEPEGRLLPLARAMTPGTMMRTRANILINVKVTWVRVARLTLQQLTATTNAADSRRSRQERRSPDPRTTAAREPERHSLSPRTLTSLMSTTGAGQGAKKGSTT